MSRLKPTLNEWMKRHEETCSCSTMCLDDLKYCDCGQIDRVADLAQLRADARAADEEHAKLVELADRYRELRDNYQASQELLAIREEQIGELLKEKAQLRAACKILERIARAAQVIYEVSKYPRGTCPHGNRPSYPAHAWWCDDCWGELGASLTAAVWLEKYPKEQP